MWNTFAKNHESKAEQRDSKISRRLKFGRTEFNANAKNAKKKKWQFLKQYN